MHEFPKKISVWLIDFVIQKGIAFCDTLWCFQMPMQEVAPRAVRMADAIEAISCTINFAVSFLVIVVRF